MTNTGLKTNLLGICGYLIIIIFMVITHFWYQNMSEWVHNYGIIFFLFSLIRFILSLIWNKLDKRNISLKYYLLFIESYLLLLMLVKPILNLNHWEFGLLYFGFILIFISLYDYDFKNKIIKIVIGILISLFMFSIHFLMVYRTSITLNDFIDQQNYHLYFFSSEDNFTNSYVQIQYTNGNQKRLRSRNQTFSFTLPHSDNQKINYLTNNSGQELFIQDKEGNILQIPSGSEITFSTLENHIKYKSMGKIHLYTNSNINGKTLNIQRIQKQYINNIKYFVLSSLPNMIKYSSTLQELSFQYTKLLSNLIPFYNGNGVIADQYLPYLDVKNLGKNEYDNKYKNIDGNWSINTKNIMGKTKIFDNILSSLSTYFHNLFTRNTFIQNV